MLRGMEFDERAVKAMTTAYEVVLVDLGLSIVGSQSAVGMSKR
jgi:hypothetical protein